MFSFKNIYLWNFVVYQLKSSINIKVISISSIIMKNTQNFKIVDTCIHGVAFAKHEISNQNALSQLNR